MPDVTVPPGMQDPHFSKRATAVVASRWWFYDDVPEENGPKWLSWQQGRIRLRSAMQDKVGRARAYEDLKGKTKALFDLVEAYNRGEPTDNAFGSAAQRRAFFAKFGSDYKAAKERGFGPEKEAKDALDALEELTKGSPRSLHEGELARWVSAISGPGVAHPLGSGEHRKRAIAVVVGALDAAPPREQEALRKRLAGRTRLPNGNAIPRQVKAWLKRKGREGEAQP